MYFNEKLSNQLSTQIFSNRVDVINLFNLCIDYETCGKNKKNEKLFK